MGVLLSPADGQRDSRTRTLFDHFAIDIILLSLLDQSVVLQGLAKCDPQTENQGQEHAHDGQVIGFGENLPEMFHRYSPFRLPN
jgi:hypothetical protein